MKKIKYWISGTLLAFSVLFMPVASFANNQVAIISITKSQYEKFKENAIKAAYNYVSMGAYEGAYKPWSGATITYQAPLFDFEDELTAFLFDVNNSTGDAGYLIVSAEDEAVVIEAAREGNAPYSSIKDEKLVYVGPTQYYIKKNEEIYYDVRQQVNIFKTNFKTRGTMDSEIKISDTIIQDEEANFIKVGKRGGVSTESIISYSTNTLTNVPDFEWRNGCSPTSFSNIIWYYRWFKGYSGLTQGSTTPEVLIDVLASSTYMNTDINNGGGTDWNDRVTGMIDFWDDRGYSVTVSRVSPNFANHKTEINNDRPDIITTLSDATYGTHDMTGVGYEEYQETTENLKWYRYLIVRDTWGSTPKSVYIYMPSLSWYETVTVKP